MRKFIKIVDVIEIIFFIIAIISFLGLYFGTKPSSIIYAFWGFVYALAVFLLMITTILNMFLAFRLWKTNIWIAILHFFYYIFIFILFVNVTYNYLILNSPQFDLINEIYSWLIFCSGITLLFFGIEKRKGLMMLYDKSKRVFAKISILLIINIIVHFLIN